ncbi:hypothetical protein ACHQM5_008601 [Ranunculus cassubicifolius]
MDSYSLLLERTQIPQPSSLQKLSVISIFQKLKSSPPHLSPDSQPGRNAITQLLYSNSPHIIDQSVREICNLVSDQVISLNRGLLELQSALEGCDSSLINVFVKGIGFLVRLGFQRNYYDDDDVNGVNHPFVRVLVCGNEVQGEVIQQVLLFIVKSKEKLGLVKVLGFLKPFLSFAVLGIPFEKCNSSFVKRLVTSIASLCCVFPLDAVPIIELLTECLMYFPRKTASDCENVVCVAECLVDAYTVALTKAVEMGLLENKTQSCGLELVQTLLSLYTDIDKHFGGKEVIVELSKRLLLAQKQLGLQYIPNISLVLTSLFIILCRTEFEHEQLSIMKLSLFLLKWKTENEHVVGRTATGLTVDLSFLLPVMNLLASPSGSVKAVATDLLYILEKIITDMLHLRKEVPIFQDELPFISRSESIVCRLLQHLWFQEHSTFSTSFFLDLASNYNTEAKEMNTELKSWVCRVRKYCLMNVERRKSLLVSQRQEHISTEMPLLLGSIVAGLVMHHSLGSYAVDTLAAIGIMDPKLGLSLLLCVIFYSKVLCNFENGSQEILLKLLEMLSSVASHSAMSPLIVQTILPMLNKDAKPVMRASAIRLLCKTWEVSDRVFGSLQGTLHPKAFAESICEKDVCISMAASVRDICKKNPDRGVDIILSVSACIENPDPTVQSLGYQSLGYLCEADVIDFYSAWSVIAKYVDYSTDPTVAYGISMLLRWGSMDAEAYPEASKVILGILWEIGTSKNSVRGSKWVKTQCSAFESLTHYEVEHIQRSIPDFEKRNREFLVSEDNPDVLKAMEGFEVKIITFQHNTRRRLLKEKRITVNKVEKLLDLFPQAVFHPGKNNSDGKDLPGAALQCGNFTPKEVHRQGTSKELPKLHAAYETALVDIAESLQLSRNILVALLSLQSWKPFMQRWLNAVVTHPDVKIKSSAPDRTSKAAADILKIIKRVAEASIPRSAENIALAIGAFCMVLPSSAHTVTATASKFLLEWLFQFEHEHMQWSAAIALGLVSKCLHATDHKLKDDIITGLIKAACTCKSTLVKGACGVGLGVACQDLHTKDNVADETSRPTEVNLIGRVVRGICMVICQLSPSLYGSLEKLCQYMPLKTNEMVRDQTPGGSYDSVMDEDAWGLAGLILGLGYSASAIYRAGGQDAVNSLKTLLMSWIPHVNSSNQSFSSHNVEPEVLLAVGSCLALPVVMDFCLKVELVTDDEMNHVVSGYRELVSELLSVKNSGSFHQNFLMASCVGAGNLISYILDEGVYSLKLEDVKVLLDLFRRCYTNQYPPTVHFGGMLGVVNMLGAGAGTLIYSTSKSSSLQTVHVQKDSSYIRGPILLAPVFEELSTSLMQEMFVSAQDPKDPRLRKYAAWAISFLRDRIKSRESHIVNNNFLNDDSDSKPVSHIFPEDSVVLQLCLWLMELNYIEENIIHVNTVATVLRCLSQAPRLPTLDWGAIIKRCMRYEDQFSDKLLFEKGSLREECIMFALVHSNQVTPLLYFLDELSDISRFRTLDPNLQACLLGHLAKFCKIYSASRLDKLFAGIVTFFSTSYDIYDPDTKISLRSSFWRGLYNYFEEMSTESLDYVRSIEKCMELLFDALPEDYTQEWSEAIKCLGRAPQNWLMGNLEIPAMGFTRGVIKKVQARVRLVMLGSIPLTELGKLKANILHTKSDGVWDVLVEVVSVLEHAEGNIKRQWLVDAMEIGSVTKYPSTVLRFIGLLAARFCRYMPLLIVDQVSVLSDLPITLPSLLSDRNWTIIAEQVVLILWRSTQRVFNCVNNLGNGIENSSIDESEFEDTDFLMRVMHCTCISLKDYLPFEDQLKLANMVVP